MTDTTRQILAFALAVAGLAWFLWVETWRGRSTEHSARVFWLHLTAPLVAILLLVLAIWLLINTDAIRRSRNLPENEAPSEAPASVLNSKEPQFLPRQKVDVERSAFEC